METAMEPIIVMDHEGRILQFNSGAEEKLGYTSGEVVGELLSDTILHSGQKASFAEELKLYLETGEWDMLDRRVELQQQPARPAALAPHPRREVARRAFGPA